MIVTNHGSDISSYSYSKGGDFMGHVLVEAEISGAILESCYCSSLCPSVVSEGKIMPAGNTTRASSCKLCQEKVSGSPCLLTTDVSRGLVLFVTLQSETGFDFFRNQITSDPADLRHFYKILRK